jgi:hypothetical protein
MGCGQHPPLPNVFFAYAPAGNGAERDLNQRKRHGEGETAPDHAAHHDDHEQRQGGGDGSWRPRVEKVLATEKASVAG